jgi:hypothetical protein
VSLSFYRLFIRLQHPLHCFDRDLLPARIVLFAVAIRLRIMAFEAWVSMPVMRELSYFDLRQQTAASPSQRSGSSLPAGYATEERAVISAAAPKRKHSPVVIMRCIMTASLRATAMHAFFQPLRFFIRRPQALSAEKLLVRARTTPAASNR